MQRVAVSEIVMIGCPNFFSLLQFYMLTQTFSKVVNSQSYPESDFLLALQKKKKKTMNVKIKYLLLTEKRLTTKFFLEKGSLVLKGG